MTPILILEAFGQLPSTDLIVSEREREQREREDPPTGVVEVGLLHNIFDARAELMGWSSTLLPRPHLSLLWDMYEAGLTGNGADASLIGWVYVGLANPIDLSRVTPEMVQPGTGAGWASIRMPSGYNEATVGLPMVLPPLVQCFDDALRRIGAVEVSGFQVTCYGAHLGPSGRSSVGHLVSRAGWFDIPPPVGADALIAFDSGFLGGHTEAELVASIQRRHTGAFEFGPPVAVPEQHFIRVPASTPRPDISLEPSGLGVPVALPQWTASAAGWVLANTINTARDFAPDVETLAVRITRVQ